MGAGVHVRVDAHRHRRPLAQPAGDRLESFQFGGRLDVEASRTRGRRMSISAPLLPTPENTVLAGAPPAASTRSSSPRETMSKPAPRRARTLSTPRLELAFIAKQTMRHAGQCVGIAVDAPRWGTGIDVERGTETLRERREGKHPRNGVVRRGNRTRRCRAAWASFLFVRGWQVREGTIRRPDSGRRWRRLRLGRRRRRRQHQRALLSATCECDDARGR